MHNNQQRKPLLPHRKTRNKEKRRFPFWQLLLMMIGGITLIVIALRFLVVPFLVFMQGVIAP